MKYDVFISYSRKDMQIADRICAAFGRAGISYFIDRQGVSGGFEFPAILAEAIINSRVVLFLASENSYRSKFTNSELTFAFNEKPTNSVLPYIIDGSQMPPALRLVFSSVNWRTIEQCAIETDLIRDINNMLGRASSAPKSAHSVSYGEVKGWNLNAMKAYDKKNYSEAFYWHSKAAEAGLAESQWALGLFYSRGNGVNVDYTEAEKLYTLAANQGDAELQYKLGCMYKHGEGVGKSVYRAAHWYSKAAEAGHVEAQNKLGICYLYGQGVKVDEDKAMYWFQKAAAQGHSSAQSRIANMKPSQSAMPDLSLDELIKRGNAAYERKDYPEAVSYFRKAAALGDSVAEWNLGICYGYGLGVPRDLAASEKWYTKAAEGGRGDLQFMLADNFNYGEGVARDLTKATYWYRRAADLGHVEAHLKLGICYLYGKGVTADRTHAIALFKTAASQGNKDAKTRLRDMGVAGY